MPPASPEKDKLKLPGPPPSIPDKVPRGEGDDPTLRTHKTERTEEGASPDAESKSKKPKGLKLPAGSGTGVDESARSSRGLASKRAAGKSSQRSSRGNKGDKTKAVLAKKKKKKESLASEAVSERDESPGGLRGVEEVEEVVRDQRDELRGRLRRRRAREARDRRRRRAGRHHRSRRCARDHCDAAAHTITGDRMQRCPGAAPSCLSDPRPRVRERAGSSLQGGSHSQEWQTLTIQRCTRN